MDVVQFLVALGGFELVRYILDSVKFSRVEKRLKGAEAKKGEAEAFGSTVDKLISLSEWQQNEIAERAKEKTQLLEEIHSLKEKIWEMKLSLSELQRELSVFRGNMDQHDFRPPAKDRNFISE